MINAILVGVKFGLALSAAVVVCSLIMGVLKSIVHGIIAMLGKEPKDE